MVGWCVSGFSFWVSEWCSVQLVKSWGLDVPVRLFLVFMQDETFHPARGISNRHAPFRGEMRAGGTAMPANENWWV